MSLPIYAERKNSGVAWLGEIPEHWYCYSARRVFREKREPARHGDEQLSATQRYGVIPQRLFMETEDQKVVLALSGTSSFKHVEKDDFVISLRSFQGGIEWSGHSGCVSPAYTVLCATASIWPHYWMYVLKCSVYVSALQTVTAGIREGKSISYSQFGTLGVPVPLIEEQKAIAVFLDRETGKIDALIAEQEKLLTLLAEKRQATISHAVTRGLNPNAPLTGCGLDWTAGQIPDHWIVAKLGHFATVENGTTPSRVVEEYWLDGSIAWLASGEVNQFQIIEASEFITAKALQSCSLRLLSVGTVVVGMVGQGKTRGMSAMLRIPATINQNLAAICPGRNIEGSYILYLLHAVYEWLREAGRGGNQAAMNCEILSSLRIPVPPIDEQREIVRFIEASVAKSDGIKAQAEHGISLLKERRSALIAAAVTGKIDVRDVPHERGA